MLKGYLVALGGVILWIVAIVIGASLEAEGTLANVLILGGFLAMWLCFVGGTVIAAVAKGYSVFIGLGLGLIAPLGLLILSFLPNRMVKPQSSM